MLIKKENYEWDPKIKSAYYEEYIINGSYIFVKHFEEQTNTA